MSGRPLHRQRAAQTQKEKKKHERKQVKTKNTDNWRQRKKQANRPEGRPLLLLPAQNLLAVVWYRVTNQENGYITEKEKKGKKPD